MTFQRWILGCCLLSLPPTALQADPSPAVVQAAAPSVFRIAASKCATSAGPGPARNATGFAADVSGSTHLVTALHAVAGCSTVKVEYAGAAHLTSIDKVLLEADLATLKPLPGVTIKPLPVVTTAPGAGESLVAIGYGQTVLMSSKSVKVRLSGPMTKISVIVKAAQTVAALQKQGFPSTDAQVIDLESPLFAGDSGAPILNQAGGVVGVANGSLLQGAMPFSWAFTTDNLSALVGSTQTIPKAGSLTGVLVAEEDLTQPAANPAAPPAPASILCGARSFVRAGVQTFGKLVSSADPFAAGHIALVQSQANKARATIGLREQFDVYLDVVSGANFIVPVGFGLHADGQDCVGRDAAGQVEIRVSTDSVPNVFATSAPANGFAMRMPRPGEFRSMNAAYATQPVPRVDGMTIQRWAEYYAVPPESPISPVPVPTEGYLTFAHRGGTLLEVSVRSLVPMVALQKNQAWFPALVGVYASTFRL